MKTSAAAADYQKSEVATVRDIRDLVRDSAETNIVFFENEVPSFVEGELEKLYANPHSSLNKFKILGRLDGASTYFVNKGGEIIVLLLFRLQKGRVQVINEVMAISEGEIRRFANAVFTRFESAAVISFTAIETNVHVLPFPFQRYNYSEDLVISLPGSSEEYLASLGNATRRNIKYYSNKLRRNFPSFNYQFYEKDNVTEQHVREVISLRSARFAEKKKVDFVDDKEVSRVLAMVRECGGMVGLATIDGNICAGQISYRTGKNDFGAIIAHDPRYNEYWLGVITCYLTICECITRGAKEFHFQWGRQEYKYRLLGVQRDLDNVNIYRSHLSLVTNGSVALSCFCRGQLRRAKLWVLDPKNRENVIARAATRSIRYLQSARQSGVNHKQQE